MSHTHNNIHVNCTMQEPLQLLADKLSTKSSDLYIFWQNYNQIYIQYNEQIIQISRLKEQIEFMRREKSRSPTQQDNYYKDRLRILQNSNQTFKKEIDKIRDQNTQLKLQNVKIQQENLNLYELIQQLKEQNQIQKNSIEKILVQLKNTQIQIANYNKIYQDSTYKQSLLNKFIQKQNQLHQCISSKDDEIDLLMKQLKQTKYKYQLIVQESLLNVKMKIIDSLPALINGCKNKIQVLIN